MEKQLIEPIKSLRSLVPVGMRHAQTLLEKTSGNIDAAADMFKHELIHLLMSSSDLSAERAREYLQHAGYEMHLALQAIEHDRFPLTERILNKNHRDKNRAIGLIAHAIETTENLTRNYWLSFDDLQRLPAELRCLMAIYEWTNYEEWEGFDSALYFHLEQVTQQLNFLQLTELASHLQLAHQRQLHLTAQHADKDWTAINALIRQDKVFSQSSDFYLQHKQAVDDALYGLAQNNIDKFPR